MRVGVSARLSRTSRPAHAEPGVAADYFGAWSSGAASVAASEKEKPETSEPAPEHAAHHSDD